MLVFFDDILIFSKSWVEHLKHLEMVFETLLQNQLYAKKSKCSFSKAQLEYLGHLIFECMKQWPLPNSLKSLRGFLGLTDYYRRFIKDYGKIS